MATAMKTVPPLVREIPHTVSPGLWALAWRRLQSDHVGMVSLAIVAAFILLMILSGAGLIAKDWNRETGVNYAPPSFIGADIEAGAPSAPEAQPAAPTPATEYKSSVVDPLADVLAEIRGEKGAAAPAGADESKTVDPLADVMADIKAGSAKAGAKGAEVVEARMATLPFGADKWGRDVLKKTIKGSRDVDLRRPRRRRRRRRSSARCSARSPAITAAGSTTFFNWFYSVFSSIPYLLLILAVAAVLQQKGIHTIILILGLTGWTGVFRLIRGEYLKHKAREYVQAADAIGASNARRMFVHIFPNVSHVVLVQLSILTVAFIKSEVILSFLGFGVPVDVVSWGSMLNEAQNELILGKWWQLVAATVAMATLVTAFSLFTDALRDALDPKLKGRMGA